MAKAWPVEIDPDESFGEAAGACSACGRRSSSRTSSRPIEGDDIEHLHDLRVAGRRLRAVLEVFEGGFPSKRHKRLLREVKEAVDPLGDARDLDVQIAFLETSWPAPRRRTSPACSPDRSLRTERDAAYDTFRPPLRGASPARRALHERAERLAE